MPKFRNPKAAASGEDVSKIRAPKRRGPRIRTPRLLENLYRDMRDRRLLLPALGLVVALVAVPILLKSSSSSAPVAPVTPAGAGNATAVEPAVLARQLGVTDYRRRLDEFKSKNPFRQHFTSLPGGSKLDTSSSLDTSSTSSTTSTGSNPSISSSTSSVTSPTTGSSSAGISPSSSTSADTSSTGTGTHHHRSTPPKTITELVQRRIDVKVGPQDAMVKKTGVKQLTFLPDATSPLVAFLGTSENGAKAFFLVSSDVTSSTGDGDCLTTTPTCQYLTLKEGQAETFDYALDPLTPYKLKLLNIHDVVVKQ